MPRWNEYIFPLEKYCTRCGKTKEANEFYIAWNGHLRSYCKQCTNKISGDRQKNKLPLILDQHREWRNKNRDKFNKNICKHRKEHPENRIKYNNNHKEQVTAEKRLQYAVEKGRIFKPMNCEKCGIYYENLHGHHWHGYNKEQWLDIQWLCPICHSQEDKLLREEKQNVISL